ncbi:virulence factor [Cohnella sp. CFH 77786]|uniref:conserved virulence factor C family protein n=1 Tax=Cohnella sp. CFH 77786 TaxID=2662265 RepID=UPI001C60F051|nr:virulence factor [Cohnella sp. CFH 77786]MBW5448410.1 virulence factor [Cohnella sp. CFH 77786]
MILLSIEPTPSPNSMKLNVDEKLAPGIRHDYKEDQADQAPPLIARLLRIPGVKGVFRTADFLALDRKGNADWAAILLEVKEVFGEAGEGSAAGGAPEAAGFGEAHVLVQMYRGIPMQIRVRSGGQESRAAMPERFSRAVTEAAGATMIRERKLEEFGVRYGEPQEILDEIVRELDAAYTDERLRGLIEQAKLAGPEAAPPAPPAPLSAEEVERAFRSDDWRERYAALERFKPEPEHVPLLAQALQDGQMSVRRLAVVYLGDLRTPETLPHLFAALKDPSAAVRRTAGDTLSDRGDPAAIGPMAEALGDANKLVRWRAARFLYEAGDETALEALRRVAAEEPEFEVRLQAEMAVARIERGEEAAGSVWQQMTRLREQERE